MMEGGAAFFIIVLLFWCASLSGRNRKLEARMTELESDLAVAREYIQEMDALVRPLEGH